MDLGGERVALTVDRHENRHGGILEVPAGVRQKKLHLVLSDREDGHAALAHAAHRAGDLLTIDSWW